MSASNLNNLLRSDIERFSDYLCTGSQAGVSPPSSGSLK